MTLTIRDIRADDHDAWLNLWHQYLVFYEHELSEEQTELTWQRLLSGNGPVYGRIAELDGKPVGFTHHSFTHSTWEKNPDIYGEDLFVDPAVRGGGVGRALILDLSDIALAAGASRLHWITQHHNATARKLYDQLGELSEFVIYERKTN